MSDNPVRIRVSVERLHERCKKQTVALRKEREQNVKLRNQLSERDAMIADLSAKWERAMVVLTDSKGKKFIFHPADKNVTR